MSSGNKKKGQKYQNKYAFKPHKDMYAAQIQKTHAGGGGNLCPRCFDIIQWRKQYGKYKPLTQPRKCTGCSQKTVTLAYYSLCGKCSTARGCCGKCLEPRDKWSAPGAKTEEEQAKEEEDAKVVSKHLSTLSERDKRSLQRQLEKGDTTEGEVAMVLSEMAGQGAKSISKPPQSQEGESKEGDEEEEEGVEEDAEEEEGQDEDGLQIGGASMDNEST